MTLNMYRPIVIPLISIFILGGCSLIFPHGSAQQEQFETRISDSGLKHFELRLTRSGPPKTPSASSQKQKTRSESNPRKSYERAQRKMEKIAIKIIETNRYCTQGFWVLEFDQDVLGTYLRGECNDIASNEDRSKFPDSLNHW